MQCKIPTSLSDHDMVGCIRKLNHTKYLPRTIWCRNYSKYDPKELCLYLQLQSWNNFFLLNDVNLAWKRFKSTISKAFDMHAPFISKKVKGKPCPWLTSDVKKHMNERDMLLRKARRTCKEVDWSNYKRKKNFCTNTIRSAKAQYHKNMLTENANNPRNFWKCIKNVIPNKSTGNTTSAPFLKDDSPINSTKKKIRNLLLFLLYHRKQPKTSVDETT